MEENKDQQCDDARYQETARLEQYKLFVETIDNISERRMKTNSFFLSIITALFTAFAFLVRSPVETLQYDFVLTVIALFGILLNIIWVFTIRAYRQVNTAKFASLDEIEEDLPYHPFKEEWQHLVTVRKSQKSFTLTHVESYVPFVMTVLFLVLLVSSF